ncbi:MAG: pyrimidine/purine nucleoside phosphorylase [Fimbriimonadaceae bacterium]|nr:pyrimidine/purine nucleoside phosphorylase [Fimbriimonadaceae bacterium]
MSSAPESFADVVLQTKANVYFDGRVVSHGFTLPSGERKTVGLIYPGAYHFGTGAPERMELVAGSCRVKLDGSDTWTSYAAGEHFDVPGNSGFDIEVAAGSIAEYVCSFLS